MVALLVQNMERLDEQVKEEADGIHNTLGKENLTLRNKNCTILLKGPISCAFLGICVLSHTQV